MIFSDIRYLFNYTIFFCLIYSLAFFTVCGSRCTFQPVGVFSLLENMTRQYLYAFLMMFSSFFYGNKCWNCVNEAEVEKGHVFLFNVFSLRRFKLHSGFLRICFVVVRSSSFRVFRWSNGVFDMRRIVPIYAKLCAAILLIE